jgi:hypothetical protein
VRAEAVEAVAVRDGCGHLAKRREAKSSSHRRLKERALFGLKLVREA